MKYIMTVDISKVEGSYDLKAYANCSYKNAFVKASMDVSDSYKNSYANNSKAVQTIVKVQGGSNSAAVNLAAANGDNDTNFSAWIESLEDVKNQTLVGLDNTKLIPIYELVDRSLTVAEDGVDGIDRYNKLKAYINGDKIDEDMSVALNMDYEMGDATHLASIPDFAAESKSQDESLIKDYYRGGQAVARICHEYIPVIDKTQRVRVIYPIVSNKVKYNMGYFAGDATHRPAKVCWAKDGLSVVSLQDQPMGAIKELYVRGSSFFDRSNEELVRAMETVDATIQPYTVSGPGKGKELKYAVVKIFNQLWMRDNYKADHTTTDGPIDCVYDSEEYSSYTKGDAFYDCDKQVREDSFTPKGWRVPSSVDFWNIQKTLTSNDVTHISTAKAFYPDKDGGVLGFFHRFNGHVLDGKVINYFYHGYYGCLRADRTCEGVFMITSDEGATFLPYDGKGFGTNKFSVRLVQDIY